MVFVYDEDKIGQKQNEFGLHQMMVVRIVSAVWLESSDFNLTGEGGFLRLNFLPSLNSRHVESVIVQYQDDAGNPHPDALFLHEMYFLLMKHLGITPVSTRDTAEILDRFYDVGQSAYVTRKEQRIHEPAFIDKELGIVLTAYFKYNKTQDRIIQRYKLAALFDPKTKETPSHIKEHIRTPENYWEDLIKYHIDRYDNSKSRAEAAMKKYHEQQSQDNIKSQIERDLKPDSE